MHACRYGLGDDLTAFLEQIGGKLFFFVSRRIDHANQELIQPFSRIALDSPG